MVNTVLAIEPDKDAQKLIRHALVGTEVVFASGKTALSEAKRRAPEVILMSVELPAEDGFKLSQRLRIDKDTSDIPIVFLSHQSSVAQDLGSTAGGAVVAQTDFRMLRSYVEKQASEHLFLKSYRRAVAGLVGGAVGVSRAERSVLSSGGFPMDGVIEAAPFAERAAKYQAIVSASLTTEQAAKRLDVVPSRIRQRLLANPPDLYGIRQGNTWCLPAFQFGGKGLVPNIEKVIPCLGKGMDLVAVDGWFRRPNIDLEDSGHRLSPLDWLSQGRPFEPVAELAKDL